MRNPEGPGPEDYPCMVCGDEGLLWYGGKPEGVVCKNTKCIITMNMQYELAGRGDHLDAALEIRDLRLRLRARHEQ